MSNVVHDAFDFCGNELLECGGDVWEELGREAVCLSTNCQLAAGGWLPAYCPPPANTTSTTGSASASGIAANFLQLPI